MTALGPREEQARIDHEASRWIVLEDDRPLTPEETRTLEVWLAADPRHRASHGALLEVWDDVPNASKALADPAGDEINVVSFQRERGAMRRSGRRAGAWAAGLCAVAAVLLAIVVIPRHSDSDAFHQFETGLAQSRTIALDDGSVVTLGPKTAIQVRLSGDRRQVTLAGGQAFFDVAPDAARPFLVEAGTSLVRVVGTKFDVNVGRESVRIAVLEGTVRVTAPKLAHANAMATLRNGQRTEVPLNAAADAASGWTRGGRAVAPVVKPALQPPGAWREGRLMYDNVRLADMIADINRYYGPGVRLDDPALGEVRVTAFFTPNEIPAFIDALPRIVAVRTDTATDGSVTIRRPRR